MSDVEKMLAEEAEHAEEHKDAEPDSDTKVSRPNRNRSNVFSVRLSDEEVRRLNEAAEQAGVAASTLARSMISRQLSAGLSPAIGQDLAEKLAPAIRQTQERLIQQLAPMLAQSKELTEAIAAAARPQLEHMRKTAEQLAARSPLNDPEFQRRLADLAKTAQRTRHR